MPYLSLVCRQSAMKINVIHLTGQEDPCLPFHQRYWQSDKGHQRKHFIVSTLNAAVVDKASRYDTSSV